MQCLKLSNIAPIQSFNGLSNNGRLHGTIKRHQAVIAIQASCSHIHSIAIVLDTSNIPQSEIFKI